MKRGSSVDETSRGMVFVWKIGREGGYIKSEAGDIGKVGLRATGSGRNSGCTQILLCFERERRPPLCHLERSGEAWAQSKDLQCPWVPERSLGLHLCRSKTTHLR